MHEKIDPGMLIALKNYTIQQNFLPRTKDKIPPSLQNSGVVYCIPCSTRPGVYVGDTCHLLEARLKQHSTDEDHFNDHTALSTHSSKLNHKFDFKNTSEPTWLVTEKGGFVNVLKLIQYYK